MKVREQKDGRLIANFQGTSRLIFGQEEAMGLRLQLDGKTVVLPNIFDPRYSNRGASMIVRVPGGMRVELAGTGGMMGDSSYIE